MVGRSTLAAPISWPGVVLSQPPSSTTASIGLPRMDSSTSMARRLRNSMAVGRIWVSPSDMAGNSSGNPPASQTPRFTNSAISRRCALHGVKFGPSVADADDGPAVEHIVGQALAFHPASVDEAVAILAAVALGTAEFRLVACHRPSVSSPFPCRHLATGSVFLIYMINMFGVKRGPGLRAARRPHAGEDIGEATLFYL